MANIQGIIDWFKTIPAKKKIAFFIVLTVVIASLILSLSWWSKADYQVLYSNLSEEDAGLIIQKMNELKAPYKVSSGGIMVPSDKVYDLRLQLASHGLPQGGGIGFELFDKTNFTMTDFVQKLNYRRALQGELSRTIRSLPEVDQCRVHLAVPEKSIFMREEERPKASVLVKLKPGRRITPGQVQGIVHLVSSSVEGMDPRDVTVIDSRGEMLTSSAADSAGMTGNQMEYQKNIEKDLEGRVVSILEPVVGKGKIKAKVNANIDFTKVEKTEEKFDPDSQVVRSEQRNVEKALHGATGGVPGVASNLPGKAGTQSASSQGQSEKKSETLNYEISKVTSHIIGGTGGIKRLTTVVLVDGTYTTPQGSTERKYSPRTEEEIRQFEDMAKKAIGFTAERNDEVRVVNMPFEMTPQEESSDQKRDFIPAILIAAKYLAPLLALTLLFVLIVRPLIRSFTSPSQAQPTLQLPQKLSELEKSLEIGEKSSKERVIEWARKNPGEAAMLIKGWLEER
jgi:flagellar M-ring protein FliF